MNEKQKKKQKWMTNEFLKVMELRRRFKVTDQEKYKRIDRQIKMKIIENNERHMQEKCLEIKELKGKYDTLTWIDQRIHKDKKKEQQQFPCIIGVLNRSYCVSWNVSECFRDFNPRELKIKLKEIKDNHDKSQQFSCKKGIVNYCFCVYRSVSERFGDSIPV